MNCGEYIERFLSAHADRELSPAELREAQAHVAGCLACAERLRAELALKAIIRRGAANSEMPAQLRARISAALDAESGRASAPGYPQPRDLTRRMYAVVRRPRVWAPVALAACLAFVMITTRGVRNSITPQLPEATLEVVYHPGGVPDFDVAVARFDAYDRRFVPNVPSGSFGEVSGAYMDHHMPGFIWNFNGEGMQLAGGRLEKMPDGRQATYTFYRGNGASIMCTRFHVYDDIAPRGVTYSDGEHYFYAYHGYSVCWTYSPVGGGFVCLLISRQPIKKFIENVVLASQ